MMKKFAGLAGLVAVYSALLTLPASAYVYHGIGPYYTTNDVRAIFSGAEVEITRWAWQKHYEKVMLISGRGINGTIAVFLSDVNVTQDKYALDKAVLEFVQFPRSAENGYLSDGVRWMPDTLPHINDLAKVYGSDYKKKTDQVNFQPYYSWKNGEISAYPNSRGYITYVSYSYTKGEYLARAKQLQAQARVRLASTPEPEVDDSSEESTTDEAAPAAEALRVSLRLWNETLNHPDFKKLQDEERKTFADRFLEQKIYAIEGFGDLSVNWREDVIKRILALEPVEVGE